MQDDEETSVRGIENIYAKKRTRNSAIMNNIYDKSASSLLASVVFDAMRP